MNTQYETVTRGIRITVQPEYMPDRSDPGANNFLFAYHITIHNEGDVPVKLLSRHWIITDGSGKQEQVRGPGVVGEQPHLQPGEGFRYTSACPLPTPVGSMQGSFQMVTDSGEAFDAAIRPFTLASPGTLH
jgi:ApaG protein